ncbi:hypothetical protein PDE_02468 [Penicillium oxalicum 114-2]|uniref:N-acetyltransferase domain-containing protein n=1 Tax=Penicillium oxalicum (strain 114-2 / CGMCC 5302) TaxID=933388 RepID=S7ZAA4_PENO1|nr:hypothetical protein PDE_02468 [Penicillium oxalicum 114-2]
METARLRLEPIDLAHLEGFHEIWSDPDTTQWSSRGISPSIDETKIRMTGILPDPDRPGIINYGVFIRSLSPSTDTCPPNTSISTNPNPNPTPTQPAHHPLPSQPTQTAPLDQKVIGIIGIHNDNPVPELGYLFHPSAWGHGYATEAVAAFIPHYFGLRPEARCIEAKVDAQNRASIRVLQKSGFEEVETLVGGARAEWMVPSVRDLVVFRVKAG